ncbi:MAG: serine/threonine-protein kinase [Planctomycetota bacterium]
MATKRDLDLARRLLRAGVLDEARIRRALEVQAQWAQQGHDAALERAIYAAGFLPKGALAPLRAPPLAESQPFTNYHVGGLLGEGGVAAVYAGTYTPNGSPVAIKVMDPVLALRDDFRDRFVREANLHIELEHENIVAGYEVGTEGGYHFYTMERIEGATVLDVIERRGFLECREALSILLQVARALLYLHEMGLVHRDIKPGNMMVEASGMVHLIDLGLIGKMGEEGDVPSQDVVTVGTVEYVSPEQARGRTDLDARTDLYSLGIALYHMVVGEVPFQGENDYEVMAKQILASVDAQKIKRRRITPEIYFLIAKLAAKERDERYPTAEEAIAVIEGYLPDGIVPVDLGVPPVAEPVAPPPRRPSSSATPAVAPARRRGPHRGDAPQPRRRRYR